MPDIPGWVEVEALTDDAKLTDWLNAAAHDLEACAAAIGESFEPGLSFAFVQVDFSDGAAPRLVVRVGEARLFEITHVAVRRARIHGVDPLGMLAFAVTAQRPVLDHTWRPKRIGEATGPTDAQMALNRRVFHQPSLVQQVEAALAQEQDVLIVGTRGSGRSALAAIVAHGAGAKGAGVISLNLTDPADGAESVVSTLLRIERREEYLLVVDGLQANLPIVDALFSCVLRLRQDFGLKIQVLATSWPSVAAVLERREQSNGLRRIGIRAEPSIRQMLDEYDIHGHARTKITELADNDVYIAALVIKQYLDSSPRQVPTEEQLQQEFTKGVTTDDERSALYQLACRGVFGLAMAEGEALNLGEVAMRRLLADDLVHRIDGAITIAPRRRALLVMRHARRHWAAARAAPPPENVVWEHLMAGGDRLIRATLSQIDYVVSPETLRPESLSLLSAWEMSEQVGAWLEQRTVADLTWDDNLGAAVFAAMALARLHRDDLWLLIAERIRARWRYDDPQLERLEPVGKRTTDFKDFVEIAEHMRLEDQAYGPAGHPSGLSWMEFDAEKDKAYRNWALGLLLCLEGKAPLQHSDSDRLSHLLKMAERAVQRDGSFYPARVPWVTARVVLGLCHADVDPQNNEVVGQACRWLLGLLTTTRAPASWWRGGTGGWNRDEATTAMCLAALEAAGMPRRKETKTALAWLISRESEWTLPDREIDLAQVVETLALCTESPVHEHLKLLLARTIDELDSSPGQPRPEERLRLPFLAAQLTEIVWRTVHSEYVRLLRDVMGLDPMTVEAPAEVEIEVVPVAAESTPVGRDGDEPAEESPSGLTEVQLHRWRDAAKQLAQNLTELITMRSAPNLAEVASVQRALELNLAQRETYYELVARLGKDAPEQTLRGLDGLGRDVCGGAWPKLP